MRLLLLLVIVSFLCNSCVSELPGNPELIINNSHIRQVTTPLDSIGKRRMDGVYEVLEGNAVLGREVAGKWVGNTWCLYSADDVVYSENEGGSVHDTLLFSGYIRRVRSATGSLVDFQVLPAEGGADITRGKQPAVCVMRAYMNDNTRITLRKSRSLPSPAKAFYTLAHRGGGRNSERLGISENSLQMIRFAEKLGAGGVEIDVRRTRDNKLIVFHDKTFSPRTVKGAYLLGNVDNYDLSQIQIFGQLVYGETIPTLEEALATVVNDTRLSLVWLDLKDAGIMEAVIQEQQKALQLAARSGRNLLILLGIPNQELLAELNATTAAKTAPILIEYDVEQALAYPNCFAWAPRWTNGIPATEIQRIHAAGKLAFTWTLDVQEYIANYLNSDFDGILSNYPALVEGMYLTK